MLIAVTRPVSASLADCELTCIPREPIDVARAGDQHAAYERALAGLGATVVRAPAAPDLPDAVFVEDTAVVLDEIAILARPGAESRRAECAGVAPLLAQYREVRELRAPATLDGGDVLAIGRTLFVGASSRTNDAGSRSARSDRGAARVSRGAGRVPRLPAPEKRGHGARGESGTREPRLGRGVLVSRLRRPARG